MGHKLRPLLQVFRGYQVLDNFIHVLDNEAETFESFCQSQGDLLSRTFDIYNLSLAQSFPVIVISHVGNTKLGMLSEYLHAFCESRTPLDVFSENLVHSTRDVVR